MKTKPEVGKKQRAPFITEMRQVDEASRTIEFVASTEAVDRYGDIIRVAGWKVDNYLKNPVFLWAHQSSQPPIGKTVSLTIEHTPPALVQTVEFATDEVADRIFKLYKGKFMRAVSVGFRPLKMPKPITDEESGRTTGWEYVGQELLELSAVPIPANQEALARAVDAGILTRSSADEMRRDFAAIEAEFSVTEGEEATDEAMEDEIEREVETVRSHTQERLDQVIARVFNGRGSEGRAADLERFAEGVKAEIGSRLDAMVVDMRAQFEVLAQRVEECTTEVAEVTRVHLDQRTAPLARESVVVPEMRLVVDTMRSAMTDLTELREEIGRVIREVRKHLEPLRETIRVVVREELEEDRERQEAERVERTVCPYVDDPIADKDTAWDAGAEMAKQTTPVGWRRMSTVIVGDPSLKGSYKLPHHQGSGFKVVPDGVRAALGRFEQTQMPTADRGGARAHLVRHQKKIAAQNGWGFDEKAFEKKLGELGNMWRDYEAGGDQSGMTTVDKLISEHVDGIFPKAKDAFDEFVEEYGRGT